MEEFISKVRSAVSDYGMITGGNAVVAALSGGADSVSLLRVLKSLESELGITVCACHLNHGLRGSDSDSDEQFCVQLCEKLNVPLEVRKVSISDMLRSHESTEQAARRVRYEFFACALEKFGSKTLATAHTASDNAETVLFNLTRGTGVSGLCGIPPVRALDGGSDLKVIRPLIYCTRNDVEGYLSQLSQDYVTDKTNLSEEYSRNRIRLNVIPELERINPSLQAVISRMTGIIREDDEFLEALSDKALSDNREGKGWNALALSKLEKPIKARAIRKILEQGGIEPSALRINSAIALLERKSARYNPCKNKFFTIRKGVCYTETIVQQFGGFNEKKTK